VHGRLQRFYHYGAGARGHGAAPHLAVDPILAAAHIVVALQSIVSRNINPQDSVVVSIGQISAGTTFNVIPDRAMLKGTVRSYNETLHRQIYRRILEMATNMATAFSCEARMETIAIVAPWSMPRSRLKRSELAAAKIMGEENIIEHRTMASEDMGYILEEVPGCYFFIGSSNEEKGLVTPITTPNLTSTSGP
jgi:amidohydrolase